MLCLSFREFLNNENIPSLLSGKWNFSGLSMNECITRDIIDDPKYSSIIDKWDMVSINNINNSTVYYPNSILRVPLDRIGTVADPNITFDMLSASTKQNIYSKPRVNWWYISNKGDVTWDKVINPDNAKYLHKWCWDVLLSNKSIPLNVIQRGINGDFDDIIDLSTREWIQFASGNPNLTWDYITSNAMIEYINQWSWESLSYNPCICLDIVMDPKNGEYLNKWDWYSFSQNTSLLWYDIIKSIIREYPIKWNWDSMSWNQFTLQRSIINKIYPYKAKKIQRLWREYLYINPYNKKTYDALFNELTSICYK